MAISFLVLFQQSTQKPDVWASFWSALPGLVWPLIVVAFLLSYRSDIHRVMRSVSGRIQAGAGMKVGMIEVAPYRVAHGSEHPMTGRNITTLNSKKWAAAEQERELDLQERYRSNHFFFLVHTLTPSREDLGSFDVLIYITPHYGSTASLLEVEKVQYYLGKPWGGKVYESVHRRSGFAMATSAYGPFLVTARIFLNDSTDFITSHYIDVRTAELTYRAEADIPPIGA